MLAEGGKVVDSERYVPQTRAVDRVDHLAISDIRGKISLNQVQLQAGRVSCEQRKYEVFAEARPCLRIMPCHHCLHVPRIFERVQERNTCATQYT